MLKFCLFLSLISATHTKANQRYSNSELQVELTTVEDAAQISPSISVRFPSSVQGKENAYSIARGKCTDYSNIRNKDEEISTRSDTRRVVLGDRAQLKEFPHMALIGYRSSWESANDPDLADWFCGGSLISERYVLSAAHCLSSRGLPANLVRLGELVIDDENDEAEPKDFRIERLFPHPKYKRKRVYHDIMLIKLLQVVTFSPHMQPICLYTSPVMSEEFTRTESITIVGWGVTQTGTQPSAALLKAQIQVNDDAECSNDFRGDHKLPNGYDPQTMICASDKDKGRDTCEGDSGGPLQVPIPNWPGMFWQLGITSYGHVICGQKNASSIYTKVRRYVPWIQSIVWP